MRTPFFRIGFGILLITVIIFMLNKINFIFKPLILLFQTLAMPFLIAGILYYMVAPVFRLMTKKGLNKTLSIFIIYLSFGLAAAGVIFFLGPVFSKQLKTFIENVPAFINSGEKAFNQFLNSDFANRIHLSDKVEMGKISEAFLNRFDKIMVYVGDNLISILSTVTSVALLVIVVPFILFYLLKEGHKIPQIIANTFPNRHRQEVGKILSEMHTAVSSYIQGQLVVSLIVGVFSYIGYVIIGIDYALLLGLVAMITNIIPFLGPYIGLGFAVAVALMHSPQMVLGAVIVVTIVQQIESNFISPHLMGKKLSIHPLTILLLLLFAGNFAGIIGMIIAVPTYAVLKVIIMNSIRIWKLKNSENAKKEAPY